MSIESLNRPTNELPKERSSGQVVPPISDEVRLYERTEQVADTQEAERGFSLLFPDGPKTADISGLPDNEHPLGL